ncbi:hypothetical protein MTO96_026446 [Rhipicephalus appendiculatus]
MNCGVAYTAMVIEALASSSSLRRLTVRGFELEGEWEARHLGPPQGPVGCLFSGYVYPGHSLATPVIPLLLQTDSDTTITSLDVAELNMTRPGVDKLIRTLMANETITELAVGIEVFANCPEDPHGAPFERYLTHRNVRLKKLTLKTFIPLYEIGRLWSLAQAISSMTTLEELFAQWTSRQELCAMFVTAVFESRSLRSVSLLLKNVHDGTVDLTPYEEGELPVLRPWYSVLRQNSVLGNLDLDVSWCRTKHCRRLLRALARKHGGLQTLSLRNLADEGCLKAVCDTIRKHGLGRRVCIKDHNVKFVDPSVLPLYPEVTAVTLVSQFPFENMSIRNVFETLATCHHVTSLWLVLRDCNWPTFDSLATYIKRASTLKEIELRIAAGSSYTSDKSLTEALQLLYKALCSNLNITKLNLSSSKTLSDDDCKMFAEYAIVNNGRLYELSLQDTRSPGQFSRRLVPPFRRNYSLLLLEVPYCVKPDPVMFGAQDVVRRNCGLVERATRFVMGERDRYGASALEFVSEHPKLVENVRREAALPGDAEARDKIAGVARLLRRMDMHKFMRVTGVVQGQVVCDYREEDDRTQLG